MIEQWKHKIFKRRSNLIINVIRMTSSQDYYKRKKKPQKNLEESQSLKQSSNFDDKKKKFQTEIDLNLFPNDPNLDTEKNKYHRRS